MYCLKCGKEIPDGSVFCQFCGAQQTGFNGTETDSVESEVTEMPENAGEELDSSSIHNNTNGTAQDFGETKNDFLKNPKNAVLGIFIGAVVLALLAILIIPGLLDNSRLSDEFNNAMINHDFSTADAIASIKSSVISDDQMSKYISAGVLYEKKAFDEAIPLFKALGDYEDSKVLFENSIEGLLDRYIQYNDYSKAIDLLNTYSTDLPEIKNLQTNYMAEFYEQALKEYKAGNYREAYSIFYSLGEYEDSGKYSTLCIIHDTNGAKRAEYYDFLMANLEFADAKDLVLSNFSIAKEYLEGSWYTADKMTNFSLKPYGTSYHANTNLPQYWDKQGYFDISDGIYYVTDPNTGARTDYFRFEIIDENKMNVYSYKGDSSYELIRWEKK